LRGRIKRDTFNIVKPPQNFEWDEKKRRSNFAKHGLDFADVARMDWEKATILRDVRFDYGEARYWAFGMMDGRLHMVAFTRLRHGARIISFRRASRKERKSYGS
jgi:uncharacterized DUF497 family protein